MVVPSDEKERDELHDEPMNQLGVVSTKTYLKEFVMTRIQEREGLGVGVIQ